MVPEIRQSWASCSRGWLIQSLPLSPPKTRPVLGCKHSSPVAPCVLGGERQLWGDTAPTPGTCSRVPPSPGRGWGLLCVPRHSGGCSGCSPHQCHGHDPAGSAAGIQNLTQKRLGGQRVSTALAENSPGHDAQLAGQGPVLATGRAVSTGSCTRRVTLPLPQMGHGRVAAAAVTTATAGRRGCRGAGVHECRCAGNAENSC